MNLQISKHFKIVNFKNYSMASLDSIVVKKNICISKLKTSNIVFNLFENLK